MNTKRKNIIGPVLPISLRITPDQHVALKALAASQHRTVSQELRVAIDNHLADAAPLKEAA